MSISSILFFSPLKDVINKKNVALVSYSDILGFAFINVIILVFLSSLATLGKSSSQVCKKTPKITLPVAGVKMPVSVVVF